MISVAEGNTQQIVRYNDELLKLLGKKELKLKMSMKTIFKKLNYLQEAHRTFTTKSGNSLAIQSEFACLVHVIGEVTHRKI